MGKNEHNIFLFFFLKIKNIRLLFNRFKEMLSQALPNEIVIPTTSIFMPQRVK
jgi:hypothetical protein